MKTSTKLVGRLVRLDAVRAEIVEGVSPVMVDVIAFAAVVEEDGFSGHGSPHDCRRFDARIIGVGRAQHNHLSPGNHRT